MLGSYRAAHPVTIVPLSRSAGQWPGRTGKETRPSTDAQASLFSWVAQERRAHRSTGAEICSTRLVLQGCLPLLAFLARADRRAVADHVRGDPGCSPIFKQLQRALPVLAFLARADRSAVADHVRGDPGCPYFLEQLQRALPLLVELARADRGPILSSSGVIPAARIVSSSSSARCHCWPFSHALIAAL